MLSCIKKLFERSRVTKMTIDAKRIDDFPETCMCRGWEAPSVIIDGDNLQIWPNGYSEFPITYIKANADIDILKKGQIQRKLKEADVEFIYHSDEDDDWYLGRAEHYQTEDGDWRWRITYYTEVAK